MLFLLHRRKPNRPARACGENVTPLVHLSSRKTRNLHLPLTRKTTKTGVAPIQYRHLRRIWIAPKSTPPTLRSDQVTHTTSTLTVTASAARLSVKEQTTDRVGYPSFPGLVAAANRLSNKLGSGRTVRHLWRYLTDGESVTELATGYDAKDGIGVLALTDHRLIFVHAGWFTHRVEDFPLSQVHDADWKSGPLGGKINVSGHAESGATGIRVSGIDTRDALRFMASAKPVLPQTPPPPHER